MSEASPIRPLERTDLRLLVEALCESPSGFRDEIHPSDEMYGYNLELLAGDADAAAVLYFAKGWQAAALGRALGEAAWADAWPEKSLLDFASGFGRATRFTAPSKVPGTFWVSDIVAPAMDFQRSTFGVEAVVSHVDPAALELDRRFDLVQVSSLFSHLPSTTFGPWLERLWQLVDDRGVLAISTLDLSLLGGARPADARSEAGFVFQPASESRVLDPESYGTAYANEAFLRTVATYRLGSEVQVRRVARGLCGHQDLYLLSTRFDLDRLAAAVPRFPRGAIDGVRVLEEGAAELIGFAASTSALQDDRKAELEIRARTASPGGVAVRAETRSDADGRWRLELDPEEIGLDTLMAVVARDRNGLESLIGVGRLRPFLAGSREMAD